MPPVSLSTGSLHTLDLAACFAMAADVGFDGVEVICDQRAETRHAAHLRGLASTHRLPIVSLHAPFPSWVRRHWRARPVASIEHTVRLAEAVGADHVVMHVPRRMWFPKVALGRLRVRWPWWSRYGAAIRRWMTSGGLRDAQSRTPVAICVENLPCGHPWLNSPWLTSWNTLADWPQAHDYLALDTTHWATVGVQPLEAYRAGGPQIRHIHLSNFRERHQHQLPHRGELDLAGFLHQLANDGFDGHLVLELSPRSLEAKNPARLRKNLADSLAFCRRGLGEAR